MSTKDGDGIETWVNMKKEDMDMFEHDQELLSYASSADGEWMNVCLPWITLSQAIQSGASYYFIIKQYKTTSISTPNSTSS